MTKKSHTWRASIHSPWFIFPSIIILSVLLVYHLIRYDIVRHSPKVSGYHPMTGVQPTMHAPAPPQQQADGVVQASSVFYPDNHFTITTPDACTLTGTVISCHYTNGTAFILNPQTMGTVSHDIIRRDSITLKETTWYRVYARNGSQTIVTYGSSEENAYYILEADYDTYTQGAEEKAEAILATFHPLAP